MVGCLLISYYHHGIVLKDFLSRDLISDYLAEEAVFSIKDIL